MSPPIPIMVMITLNSDDLAFLSTVNSIATVLESSDRMRLDSQFLFVFDRDICILSILGVGIADNDP